MDQFWRLRNLGVKFGENWITLDLSRQIKSALEIHVYAYKWLKNNGIVVKFGMNMYFINLNHITKCCYDRSIIVPSSEIGRIKEICLIYNNIIGLKIVLPR